MSGEFLFSGLVFFHRGMWKVWIECNQAARWATTLDIEPRISQMRHTDKNLVKSKP